MTKTKHDVLKESLFFWIEAFEDVESANMFIAVNHKVWEPISIADTNRYISVLFRRVDNVLPNFLEALSKAAK